MAALAEVLRSRCRSGSPASCPAPTCCPTRRRCCTRGRGTAPGNSSINWNTAADLPTEIADLNQAYAAGNEIGTHFNGHFCEGAEPSGNCWTTDDWNNELDQFFALVKNVKANNPAVTMPDLAFDGSEVKGERTPCLEGHAEDLFPALTAHNMTYDSSFTKTGISWPKQSPQYKIWQFGMADLPDQRHRQAADHHGLQLLLHPAECLQ